MPPKARAPVAANPEPEAAPALTAALSLQFPRITDQDHELHALLSLQALAASEQDENSRPPVELMLVLDRSGSMAGAPLTLVKRAAEFVVDHLGDGDKVGGGCGVRAGGGGTEEEDKEEMLFVPFKKKSCSLATTKTSTKYNCHNR